VTEPRRHRWSGSVAARAIGAALVLAAGLAIPSAQAQTGICARVKIEILQQMTFERVAFDARLVVTNNLPDQALTDFRVNVNITDESGNPVEDLFFVSLQRLQNIDSVDGAGTLPATARAEANWLLVPSYGAGGTEPRGRRYYVGGRVSFTASGEPIELDLFPDDIVVYPQPLLDVTYFLPREVQADDPFTPPVEAPVPFSLGVRVSNKGFGTAGNLQIQSGQPRITENELGLLIDFKLLGTAVNGGPVSPTLTPALGTIRPQGCSIATWQMVTTLSGQFIAFEADYVHAAELGGELTSLIDEVQALRLVHEMLVDLPGRDGIPDFLADVDEDPEEFLPDVIYESDCAEQPVNPLEATTTGFPTPQSPQAALTSDLITGWGFMRVPDPAAGLIPLRRVVRSDGKQLHARNFWISRVQDKANRSVYHSFVNIVDFDTTGAYTLFYEQPPLDTTAPVTTAQIGEPKHGTAPVFVSPATQIFFTAEDDSSGVGSIQYRLDGGAPQPAFPFHIDAAGPHTIVFFSTDRASNREADRTLAVVVDPDPPVVQPIAPLPAVIVPGAPEGVPAARTTTFAVDAADASAELRAAIAIAAGSGGSFDALPRVRSFELSLSPGAARTVTWDGKTDAGLVVPEGSYTIRVTIDDFLGHAASTTATVVVDDFLAQDEIDPVADADQMFPDLAGDRLVWQDNRNENWDIVLHDLAGGATVNLTSGQAADQERPRTDGRYVVWQDRRAGNWDVFLYDSTTQATTPLTTEVADQQFPVVDGPWVVWQERGETWDIVALNLDTAERVVLSPTAASALDQIHPAIDGTTVAWEDYRFGLGEIFSYDLGARVERRITTNIANQSAASVAGGTVVWVDQRNQNRDLYAFDLGTGLERRLTYTSTDEAQPDALADRIVYTAFPGGLADPGIAMYQPVTRRSFLLTPDPARQEEPAADGDRIAWQDNRTGRWQIRMTSFAPSAQPLVAVIEPGYNLVAVTTGIATASPSAFDLLAALQATQHVTEIQSHDPATGRLRIARWSGAAAEGDDFDLVPGTAIALIAGASGTLALGDVTTCPEIPLATGVNYVGYSCVSPGFTARDLLQALGPANVASIARYDARSGSWQTLAVSDGETAGSNFVIEPGVGILIYSRVALAGGIP
jgi:beta propeller repeat protein